MPKFKNLLLPRTTGFNFILEECKRTGIDVLYDITALYQDKIPQAKVDFSFNLIFEQLPTFCIDENCFFVDGLPTETHYIIKKHKISDITKNYLLEAWKEKDKELEIFYNQGQIEQKKIATPVSSQTWLVQNIGRANLCRIRAALFSIFVFSPKAIIFWPWFVIHNFYNLMSYWPFLLPSFLVMFTLMKLNDGDLSKFALRHK